MKESINDTVNGKDWQRGQIREWDTAQLQERDRKSEEGVNNYFTEQTIRLRD